MNGTANPLCEELLRSQTALTRRARNRLNRMDDLAKTLSEELPLHQAALENAQKRRKLIANEITDLEKIVKSLTIKRDAAKIVAKVQDLIVPHSGIAYTTLQWDSKTPSGGINLKVHVRCKNGSSYNTRIYNLREDNFDAGEMSNKLRVFVEAALNDVIITSEDPF